MSKFSKKDTDTMTLDLLDTLMMDGYKPKKRLKRKSKIPKKEPMNPDPNTSAPYEAGSQTNLPVQ